MEKITLSIFVPCFNEENNITNTLNNIKEGIQYISYEVLIADDASKDKTIEMVEIFKKNNPNINIKIFRNKNNKGIGFNFCATAHKASGKYYMTIQGDALLPGDIKKIVNNIGKADMILTYFIDKREILRRVVSKIFVIIINLITLNNIKYYNGSNVYLLENIKLCSVRGSGFGFSAEVITEQIRQKKTYTEIMINPVIKSPEISQLFKLHNVPSVALSIISTFLNQIIYVVKKILKIN